MHTQQTGHSLIRKGYNLLCKIELVVAAILFLIIVSLVFISAITRKMGVPIQWTMDVTQLLFAWLSFLSGDIALRNGVLPGLDMVVLKMPKKVQVVLKYVVRVLMLALLVFFVHFGFKLAFSNLKRTFQTLGISYSWVTISLPVCSILMILSLLVTSFDEISQFAKR